MKSLPTILAVLVVAGGASTLSGQTLHHVQFGDPTHDRLGTAAASLGDVDNDGVPDYAFGTFGEFTQGEARVYSGATGETITTLIGNHPNDRFGSALAGLGDVNGDGVPDLLVGANADGTYGVADGMARVYSGSDWSILREHPAPGFGGFGTSVAALGDVDSDGAAEYLISEPGNVGDVSCFSGATGALLWNAAGGFFDGLGFLAPNVGDANDDGVPDALIGAAGFTNPSYVVVLDGTDGSEIHRVTGSLLGGFGRAVSWLGDLNGDQRSEFAVGSPGQLTGRIFVYDGASAALLHSFDGTARLGDLICGLGDQDGDGVPDIVASDNNKAFLYSGANGDLIHPYETAPITSGLACLAPAGDLDADGSLDLLYGTSLGESGSGSNGTGMVFLSASHTFQDLGQGLAGAGGAPSLVGNGTMQTGSVNLLRLTNTKFHSLAVLFVGLSAGNTPFLGGTLVPAPGLTLGYSTGANATVEVWSTISPVIPSQTEFTMQFWVADATAPRGATASNALKAVVP